MSTEKVTASMRRDFLIQQIKKHPNNGLSPKRLREIYSSVKSWKVSESSCRTDLNDIAANGHAIGIAKNTEAMRWYPRDFNEIPK